MEAPEKIYLYTEGHVLDNDWLYEAPEEFTSFEYTRTDFFIEKAREWFEMQNEGIDSFGNYKCDMTDFEDFKNYMEREKNI